MYKREKITEEEAKGIAGMFNWMANPDVAPLLARASINIIPQAVQGGDTRLMYEVYMMQDTHRSLELSHDKTRRYYEVRGTGETLEQAMENFSTHIELLK